MNGRMKESNERTTALLYDCFGSTFACIVFCPIYCELFFVLLMDILLYHDLGIEENYSKHHT